MVPDAVALAVFVAVDVAVAVEVAPPLRDARADDDSDALGDCRGSVMGLGGTNTDVRGANEAVPDAVAVPCFWECEAVGVPGAPLVE